MYQTALNFERHKTGGLIRRRHAVAQDGHPDRVLHVDLALEPDGAYLLDDGATMPNLLGNKIENEQGQFS